MQTTPPTRRTTRLESDLSAMRLKTSLARLRLKAGFRPNQPRVPAGSPQGGRWAETGRSTPANSATSSQTVRDRSGELPWSHYVEQVRADGSVASTTIANRDGSNIQVEPSSDGRERSSVVARDGTRFHFEANSTHQRIFNDRGELLVNADWAEIGPISVPTVRPVFQTLDPLDRPQGLEIGPGAGGGGVAALSLYNWWLSRGTDKKRPALVFGAGSFGRLSEREPLVWMGILSHDQVRDACKHVDQVQRFANDAAKQNPRNLFSSDAVRGTAIHKSIKDKIAGLNNPRLKAEESISKSTAARAKYGEKGSIRIDVLELREDNVTCVYDVKTGFEGLAMGRVKELGLTVGRHYPTSHRIIVVEVLTAL